MSSATTIAALISTLLASIPRQYYHAHLNPIALTNLTDSIPQAPLPQAEDNPNSLDSLFKAKNKLYFGTISDPFLLSLQPNIEVITGQFGQLTHENSLKWEAVHPERDVYSFEAPDMLVDFAEENEMSVRGHTLVWHSQLPPYMNDTDVDGNPTEFADPVVLEEFIREHVRTVMGRYKGRVRSWDIVNEAFGEDGIMRDSVFFRVLGEDFVRIAFEEARATDPEAVLYINDFNLDTPTYPKLEAGMVPNVRRWLEMGWEIDGIGTQTHLIANRSFGVLESLELLASTGVKEIAITELDVTEAVPEEYVEVIEACLVVDKCIGITVWGVADPDSWRVGEDPLLFDGDFNPKPAFDAIVDALF